MSGQLTSRLPFFCGSDGTRHQAATICRASLTLFSFFLGYLVFFLLFPDCFALLLSVKSLPQSTTPHFLFHASSYFVGWPSFLPFSGRPYRFVFITIFDHFKLPAFESQIFTPRWFFSFPVFFLVFPLASSDTFVPFA